MNACAQLFYQLREMSENGGFSCCNLLANFSDTLLRQRNDVKSLTPARDLITGNEKHFDHNSLLITPHFKEL